MKGWCSRKYNKREGDSAVVKATQRGGEAAVKATKWVVQDQLRKQTVLQLHKATERVVRQQLMQQKRCCSRRHSNIQDGAAAVKATERMEQQQVQQQTESCSSS